MSEHRIPTLPCVRCGQLDHSRADHPWTNPVEDRLTLMEARIAAFEAGQLSTVATERERCAMHVGSLLDVMVNDRHAAFPAGEIVKALRAIEQAIRGGDVEMLKWGPKGFSR